MTPRTRGLLIVLTLALSTAELSGFVLSGHKWNITAPVYYVNPANARIPEDTVLRMVALAANAWADQAGVNIRPVYGGYSPGGSLVNNHKSEIFFRAGPSDRLANTWAWYENGYYVDADIVLYEDVYPLFAESGCEGGVYLEDILIHEFGHFLGLNHTDVAGATMQPNMPAYCDRTQLTLEDDDVQGIRALYPVLSPEPPPPIPLPSGPTLTARGYKVKGYQKADLRWTGLDASTVGIERNGVILVILANTGNYTDPINRKGGGDSYRYRVCAGDVCTNAVGVSF